MTCARPWAAYQAMPSPDDSTSQAGQEPAHEVTPAAQVVQGHQGQPGFGEQDLLQSIQRLVADSPEAVSMFGAAISASAYSGPLPSPDHLRGYEEVVPGSANRIITMAESQSAHRQEIEKIAVKGGNSRSWWGLWLGFVLSVMVLGLSAGLILAGDQVAGTVLGSVDLVSLASVFVIGRVDQRRERVAKDQATHLPPPAPPPGLQKAN